MGDSPHYVHLESLFSAKGPVVLHTPHGPIRVFPDARPIAPGDLIGGREYAVDYDDKHAWFFQKEKP